MLSYYLSQRKARPCCCATVLSVCMAGLGLIIGGSVLLAIAEECLDRDCGNTPGPNYRQIIVGMYNNAVLYWQTSGSPATPFAAKPYVYSTHGQGTQYTNIVSGADPLKIDRGADVFTYPAHLHVRQSYTDTGVLLPSVLPGSWNPGQPPSTVNIQVTEPGNNPRSATVGVPVGWTEMTSPCTSKMTIAQCTAACSAWGGGIVAGTGPGGSTLCQRWFILTDACFVINTAGRASGLPLLDNSSVYGFGCTSVIPQISQLDSLLAQKWAGVLYGRIGSFNFSMYPYAPGNGKKYTLAATFTLRHSMDPYVTAMRLTGGQPSSFTPTGCATPGCGPSALPVPSSSAAPGPPSVDDDSGDDPSDDPPASEQEGAGIGMLSAGIALVLILTFAVRCGYYVEKRRRLQDPASAPAAGLTGGFAGQPYAFSAGMPVHDMGARLLAADVDDPIEVQDRAVVAPGQWFPPAQASHLSATAPTVGYGVPTQQQGSPFMVAAAGPVHMARFRQAPMQYTAYVPIQQGAEVPAVWQQGWTMAPSAPPPQ